MNGRRVSAVDGCEASSDLPRSEKRAICSGESSKHVPKHGGGGHESLVDLVSISIDVCLDIEEYIRIRGC